MSELLSQVKAEIEEALASAWDAPDPAPESALRHVFREAP